MRWVTSSRRAASICRNDPFSLEVLKTGEVRIADKIHELSEYASFVVYRGRILLTADRGMLIWRVGLNPLWKAMALRKWNDIQKYYRNSVLLYDGRRKHLVLKPVKPPPRFDMKESGSAFLVTAILAG
jgi:hypothetical protein